MIASQPCSLLSNGKKDTIFQYFKGGQKFRCLCKMPWSLNVGYCSIYLNKVLGEPSLTMCRWDPVPRAYRFSRPCGFPLLSVFLILNCLVTTLTTIFPFFFPILIPVLADHFHCKYPLSAFLRGFFIPACVSCSSPGALWCIRDGHLQSRRKY